MRGDLGRWGPLVGLGAIAVMAAAAYFISAPDHGETSRLEPVGVQLEEREETGPCQAGRWPVKTLQDALAGQVRRTADSSSVAALGQLPAPGVDDDTPRLSGEKQAIRIRASLYADHLEPDLDFHVVVHDPKSDSSSMIVELPNPTCTRRASALDRAVMDVARQKYVLACGPAGEDPGTYYVRGQADITGVRFFDTIEGQFGRAANAIELHPVFDFTMLGPCTKFGGPTRFSVGSSIAQDVSLTAPTTWSASTSPLSAQLRSVQFLIDGVSVARVAAPPFTLGPMLDPGTLAFGTHYLTVVANWADGSIARVTTRANVPPAAALRPVLATTPRTARPGATLRVTGTHFLANETIQISLLNRGGGRLSPDIPALATRTGAIAATLSVPAKVARGRYTVRTCQSSCTVRATTSLTVR